MKTKVYPGICLLITASMCLLNTVYSAPAVAVNKTTAITNQATSGDKLDKQLQALLDQTRTQNNIVNMSMSVSLSANSPTRNYVSGTLKLNGSKKVTPDTLFQIGSITKSFTDAIILQLEAEGKLNIHDTVGKYLPNDNPKWNNVTLIQLMNMTSGIYEFLDEQLFDEEIFDPSYRYKTWPLFELANYAYNKHSDLEFPPGTKWRYSNTAYILLGMIIKQVTGHRVANEFNLRLLGSNSNLGLSNTYYLPINLSKYPASIRNRLANYYYKTDDGVIDNITDINMSIAATAGAIISDPKDIITWVRDLFGTKVLPESKFKEMTTEYWFPVPSNTEDAWPPNTYYGFGLLATKDFAPQKKTVFKGITWWYQGGTFGGTFLFILLPDNTIITFAAGNSLDPNNDFYLFLNTAFVEQVVITVENYKKTHPFTNHK